MSVLPGSEVRAPCGCGSAKRWRAAAGREIHDEPPARAVCSGCGEFADLRTDRLTEGGGLGTCLLCGHVELYTAKVFPRAAGVSIVVLAAVAAPFTHYLSLAAAAALDALLWVVCPDEVRCYVCHAAHRGFARRPRHPRFDREIQERLRYGERAVMGKPMRPGGTAGAPEPEH